MYNFEYKVADEEAQTYISRSEERDGDALTGSYSYVDATGSLITVNYNAGVDGYTETRTKEGGFVEMRAIPPWDGPLAGVEGSGTTAVARGSSSSSGSTFGSSSRTASAFGSRSGSSSSSFSQSDLIARIIAALEPQINSAVSAAIAN